MSASNLSAQAVIAQLLIYPVKSCAPVPIHEVLLTDQGLDLDRAWMVVDERGQFVSQREQPRLARVEPQLRPADLVLRAPGMLALHLGLETVESAARVFLWDEAIEAWDMGAVAAQWFSDYLGQAVRLVRFDPQFERPSQRRWTGGQTALNTFTDGFPMMLLSQPSLEALNARLQASGRAPVPMLRFRPNIVLASQAPPLWQPHDEDRALELQIDTADGPVRLKPVKPCSRCSMVDVDPATGTLDPGVLSALHAYRRDPRLDGAVSFGMNLMLLEGLDRRLRVGQPVQARLQAA